MADVINLRRERKRKARADAERRAAENRARHGRSSLDKGRDDLEARRAERAHEGHKIGAEKTEPD